MRAADLPRDLAPWREELSCFPTHLVLSLEGTLRRLRALIGPLRAGERLEAGDPDGYHGLSRRGPYERLVASEWLLADVVPEEFDRRAAMGEHLFVDLAQRAPRSEPRMLALFDCGPAQLGGPRLVQLAVLILLAGRARAAGVDLLWGTLQSPASGLLSGVTPETVLRLLAGRCLEPAAPAHLDGFEELRRERAPDDLWLVGARAPGLRTAEPGATHLWIEESLVPGERTLAVGLERPREPARSVVLELPPDRVAIDLLRNPFGLMPAVPRVYREPLSLRGGLRFGSGGRRLLARGRDGGVVAFHVPSSPREESGRTRRLPPPRDGELVAASLDHRHFAAAVVSGHTLTIRRVDWPSASGGAGALIVGLPPHLALAPAPIDQPLGLCVLWRSGSSLAVAVVDTRGRALEWSADHVELIGDPRGRVVAADGEGRDLLLVAEVPPDGVEPNRWVVSSWHGPGSTKCLATIPAEGPSLGAAFGCGGRALAVERAPGSWLAFKTLPSDKGSRELHPGEGTQVVAVVPETDLSVVILEDDRRTFSLVSVRHARVLTRAGGPVCAATSCRAQPLFAFLTTGGHVTVFSLEHRTAVLQAHAEPEP